MGFLKILQLFICVYFPTSPPAAGLAAVRIIYLLISGDLISVSALKEKKLHAIKNEYKIIIISLCYGGFYKVVLGTFFKNLNNNHIQCFSFWQIMARFLL